VICSGRANWANDSAHRWRPLRDSRISKPPGGAAIRCSAWFDPVWVWRPLRVDTRNLPGSNPESLVTVESDPIPAKAQIR